MKATQQLHNLGQSLWLDNITRDLIESGTLRRYIEELSVTGLTSNPTIFDHAIKNSAAYDPDDPREGCSKGSAGRASYSSNLALEDITPRGRLVPARSTSGPTVRTAGHRSKSRRWLAHDTASTIAAAKDFT